MVLRLGSVLFETHRSVEDSEAFLRFAVEGYERGDLGGWGVVLKDSGAFVGACGVDVNYAPEHAHAELGYVLSREHWGKGLMHEAEADDRPHGFGHEPQPHTSPLHGREHRLPGSWRRQG
jgi:[ribosomal protein S5]-alanine N-acetyltransferase